MRHRLVGGCLNGPLVSGKPYGADDFLPVLLYVLARSDLTEMLLNVEYMMELMDPALQLGEGKEELRCIALAEGGVKLVFMKMKKACASHGNGYVQCTLKLVL